MERDERDRDSIGLTPDAQRILSDLDSRGWFQDYQHAARFALAYAIRHGVGEGTVKGTETRWAAGNFDNTGEIRAALAALFPTSRTPVRLMEHLVNEGLQLVAAKLRSDEVGPGELIDE
jgi:hypothetical protein